MIIIRSKNELIERVAEDRENDIKITLIPTMGNLHKGHTSLIDTSDNIHSKKIVSIFINPLQFNNPRDFDSYPKSLEDDLNILGDKKVDYIFLPDHSEMIDNIAQTDILPWGFDNLLCGTFRGKHFDGVQKIVRKLFEITNPDHAIFGEKDFQQYLLIKYIVQEYFPQKNIDIILSPTVRMDNGLAFSSRNTHLSKEQVNTAALAFKSIKETVTDYFRETSLMNFDKLIPQSGGVTYQYVKMYREDYLYDKHGLKLPDNPKRKTFRLFIALIIDSVRLIDNYPVEGYDIS
tara:strand:- start:192 stop:1061 length:870 start_codon:yes stop_codon:yes gene_type:complete